MTIQKTENILNKEKQENENSWVEKYKWKENSLESLTSRSEYADKKSV